MKYTVRIKMTDSTERTFTIEADNSSEAYEWALEQSVLMGKTMSDATVHEAQA